MTNKNVTIKNIIAFIAIALMLNANAQITQTIRGTVVDQAINEPLPGASIILLDSFDSNGITSNNNGQFKIDNVPVGRHAVQISFMGYESMILPSVLVTSAKECILNIKLKEKVNNVGEIIVKGGQRDKPLNKMITLSAVTLSGDETTRFAGGLDDPGRSASVYAGVADGTVESNGIVVRGNAPTGVIYRVEGMQVNNPNHFYGEDMLGGGFLSVINNHLLDNSDFLTGAFPAEYGNALSAVFDFNLKTGNTDNYEHAFQAGILGIDFASEGPIQKGSGASYLFNYRYSTFGLVQNFMSENEGLPSYQDLSFKLNFSTKAGTFTLFGCGGSDDYKYGNEFSDGAYHPGEIIDDQTATGFVGLKHKLRLNSSTYLTTSVLTNASVKNNYQSDMHTDLQYYTREDINYLSGRHTASLALNKKFSAKHFNKTGVNFTNLFYDMDNNVSLEFPETPTQLIKHSGSTNLLQAYSQSKFDFSDKFAANIGIHSQYLMLTEEFTFEPRVGTQYNINSNNMLSLAYGHHAQTQLISTYFVQNEQNGNMVQPNKDLRFTKAHHVVLAYDHRINAKTRIKIEPFYQYLYDVPVINDSSFSILNLEDINRFNEGLVNEGTATNIGIDLTLERFFYNGLYYLVTASVFNSQYVGGDNIERSTLYNKNFVGNIVAGKEWNVGKNSILGANARIYLNAGDRLTPINIDASMAQQETVFDYTKLYEDKKPFGYRCDLGVSYRRNKEKYSTVLSFQLLNALQSITGYGNTFNKDTQQADTFDERTSLPNISWRIEF